MPSNLLILALLAGFVLVHRSHVFRFRAQLLDGYRLLFYCSIAGTVLLGVSRVLVCFAKLFPVFWYIRPAWGQFAGVPYLGTFIGSLVLGILVPEVWNRFVDAEECHHKEVMQGDALLGLLQQAVDEERMVSISFENRKWYAGYVAEAPNLKPTEKYFKLLPVLSGYRDKDTLAARRTLSYEALLLSEIVSPQTS